MLEMLAGPLPGIYDPTGPGRLLFDFFATMAETERENIGEPLEGLETAALKDSESFPTSRASRAVGLKER
ncbi:recombinase family protein [Streptomyces doebereineriae]|uniref:hypothetical protein n=1 Tax=Streptomyces doebereineriae TaxID=3075528 RepID=UPI00374E05C3